MGLVRGFLVRPLLAMAWALVLWGTLLAAAVAVHGVRDGMHAAWLKVAALSAANLGCLAAALAVWVALAGLALARRGGR